MGERERIRQPRREADDRPHGFTGQRSDGFGVRAADLNGLTTGCQLGRSERMRMRT
jgi:hypothetical protein